MTEVPHPPPRQDTAETVSEIRPVWHAPKFIALKAQRTMFGIYAGGDASDYIT